MIILESELHYPIQCLCVSATGTIAYGQSKQISVINYPLKETVTLHHINDDALIEEVKKRKGSLYVSELSFSYDSELLLSGDNISLIIIWNVRDACEVSRIVYDKSTCLTGLAFIRNKKNFISSQNTGLVSVWSVDGQLLNQAKIVGIQNFDFSQYGQHLITVGYDCLTIWHLETLKILQIIHQSFSMGNFCNWQIIAQEASGLIQTFKMNELLEWDPDDKFDPYDCGQARIAVSPSGYLMACAQIFDNNKSQSQICVFRLDTYQDNVLCRLDKVSHLVFSYDDDKIIAATRLGQIAIIDVKSRTK